MSFPYFPAYPDRWLGSQAILKMSPAEEGAYFHLLCISWNSSDCGLPDDDEELAKLSRLGNKWPRSKEKIRAQFDKIDSRLHDRTLLKYWKKANKTSKLKAKAAEERWDRKKYFESELSSYKILISDTKWLIAQQRFHPDLDIPASLEKAHAQFWSTEQGYQNFESKNHKSKDWKFTFEKSLSHPINQVKLNKKGHPNDRHSTRSDSRYPNGATSRPGEFDEGVLTLDGIPSHR